MDRHDALNNLIAFREPVSTLTENMSKFDWDYEDQPVVVTASQIQAVLTQYLTGKFSSTDIEAWANLIECREDLEFEDKRREEIAKVVYQLANPTLEGSITHDSCRRLVATLDAMSE